MRESSNTLGCLNVWRWIHFVTIFFVLSFIAFDVLDLDLSDFAVRPPQKARLVALAAMPATTQVESFIKDPALRPRLLSVNLFVADSASQAQLKDILRVRVLHSLQVRIHKITHPQVTAENSPSPA